MIESGFETSQPTANTLPSAVRSIAFLAVSSTSMRRARIATSAPDSASRVATASPRPRLPPVTRAVRLSRRISIARTPTGALSLAAFHRCDRFDFDQEFLLHEPIDDQQRVRRIRLGAEQLRKQLPALA